MKNTQLYRKIVVLVAVALLSGGAIAYADFIRTTGSSGFGYGYGYDTDSSTYGYGYGYLQSDTSPTNRELYGFSGTDGAATGIVTDVVSCTAVDVIYTSDYLAKHNVAYGISLTSENGTTLTDFESGAGSISLTGLSASTTYIYVVNSIDSGSTTWASAQRSFTTPSCSSNSNTSGGGGGGGGGMSVGGSGYATPGSGSQVGSSNLGGPQSSGYTFARNLIIGMSGLDVKELQNYLNKAGYNVGLADGKFGAKTKAGLIKFQLANKIVPASGYFGPLTRAFVNSQNTLVTSTPTRKFTFLAPLKAGARGNEAKELQSLLNKLGFDVGNADGVFGPKTKAGVIKFQLSKGLKGDGIVGPNTRAELNK